MIWSLIKFFADEVHADQFMAGGLYLNTLAYFKELESGSDDGRMDLTEAVAMWWQPHDISIKLNVPGIGETEITNKDLAGPVSMAFEFHDYWHVFCLYALYTTGFECIDGKIACTSEDAEALRRQLKIDEQCFKFGNFAVAVNALPFIDQLREALKGQGLRSMAKLVEYYDNEEFHGEIPIWDIPFRKQKRFSYQREFRLCVDTGTRQRDAITINIGDISHISAKMESSMLPGAYRLEFESAPGP